MVVRVGIEGSTKVMVVIRVVLMKVVVVRILLRMMVR